MYLPMNMVMAGQCKRLKSSFESHIPHVSLCVKRWHKWLAACLSIVFSSGVTSHFETVMGVVPIVWTCWVSHWKQFDSPSQIAFSINDWVRRLSQIWCTKSVGCISLVCLTHMLGYSWLDSCRIGSKIVIIRTVMFNVLDNTFLSKV